MDPELRLPSARPSRKRNLSSYAEDNDEPSNCQSPPNKTKKTAGTTETIDLTVDAPPESSPRGNCKQGTDTPIEEKRLKRFRPVAPQSYLRVRSRALTQRLTVLSRERCGSDQVPEEKIVMAGSTGNVYTQRIGLVPRCNCPHAIKGNQCKHIIYIMLRVLKAPEKMAYQLALTTSELRDILNNAPPIPGSETNVTNPQSKQDGNRKPIEGECPICYDDLHPDKDDVQYCKASCGNNVHKDCMRKWIAISRGKATCPYCRAIWTAEDSLKPKLGDIDTTGLATNEDGYVNVARQLGLSSERDYSSYHQPWARHYTGSYEYYW